MKSAINDQQRPGLTDGTCLLTGQLAALAKGQLLRTEKGHIQIVDLGKMLVHYRILLARLLDPCLSV